jgi:hypothetical protein
LGQQEEVVDDLEEVVVAGQVEEELSWPCEPE